MKIMVLLLLLTTHYSAFHAAASPVSDSRHASIGCQQHPSADSLQFRIIKAADNTYGYDILRNGKLLIHQPSVPCIQGNRGFSKKTDAEKLAVLVMGKIRKGIMPPSVTEKEMKDLGLTYQR